jgi:carbonic anhydrase
VVQGVFHPTQDVSRISILAFLNAIKPAALIAKSRSSDPAEALSIAVRENVLQQVKLLRGLEPVLSNQFASGNVLIMGAVYNLHTGQVEFMEEAITSLPKFSKL